MLKLERWELTVTSAEGIDMVIGMGFFAGGSTGVIICLSSPEMERWPER